MISQACDRKTYKTLIRLTQFLETIYVRIYRYIVRNSDLIKYFNPMTNRSDVRPTNNSNNNRNHSQRRENKLKRLYGPLPFTT